MDDTFALLDWKRRVFALYQSVRSATDVERAWDLWREGRDDLFRTHPQSPLPEAQRGDFPGLRYFDYAAQLRVLAEVRTAEPELREIGASGDQSVLFRRFATASFELAGQELSLDLHWLEGYGGGIFLPFADATSGGQTYGAGRYLFDTVKGADLGADDGRLVLDFNFAYNPSCCYDPRWVCPLAPQPNRLAVPVEAGEQAFTANHAQALR